MFLNISIFLEIIYVDFKSNQNEPLGLTQSTITAQWDQPEESFTSWHFDKITNQWKELLVENDQFHIDQIGYYALAKPLNYVYATGYFGAKDNSLSNTAIELYANNNLLTTT